MAAASFDEALRRLLAHEGGYGNHPSDPGGPTKYGITIADYRRYVKPDASAADVKAMPVAQAKAIYRLKYWDALACDRLPAGLDCAVFDYGVNSGTGRAAKVLRQVAGAPVGGGIDAAVLARIATRDVATLIGAVCDERMAFLRRLKTFAVFGKGWTRRVAEVRAASLALAAQTQAPARAQQADAGGDDRFAGATAPGGKGVASVNRVAQRGSAIAAATAGAVAAERAHAAGLSATTVLIVVLAAALTAAGAWMFWRWRQRREQQRVAIAP